MNCTNESEWNGMGSFALVIHKSYVIIFMLFANYESENALLENQPVRIHDRMFGVTYKLPVFGRIIAYTMQWTVAVLGRPC